MKIGVLGAPGSGKSEFAIQLNDELMANSFLDRFVIIDRYVDDLRGTTGLEYGEYGSFIDDLQVVFKRREYELTYGRGGNSITVGTVLDSTVHNFVQLDGEIAREHVGLHVDRLKAIASTFGLVYTESWDYDYAFMLRKENDLIDKALVDLIATYRAPVLSFDPKVPDDEKASIAATAIRSFEKEPATSSDEYGVRSGDEDGKTNGNFSEPVPDVRESREPSDDA